MNIREGARPGGRSARVQASVHSATRELLAEMERPDLTIPLIATRAGVTPSTIYRRWGDLQELLADVAVERLRPESEPTDTGSARTDLLVWAEQYAEEMSSDPGRAMIRDVLASTSGLYNAGQCCGYTSAQLDVIARRAGSRENLQLDVDTVIDHLVAPLMYRILFDNRMPTLDDCRRLVDRLLPEN